MELTSDCVQGLKDNTLRMEKPTVEESGCCRCLGRCFPGGCISASDRISKNIKSYPKVFTAFAVMLFLFSIGQIVGGAVKVDSTCDKERLTAIFILSKGVLDAVIWSIAFFFLRKKLVDRALRNPCVRVFTLLAVISFLGLIIAGSTMSFGFREEILHNCTETTELYFMNFAVAACVKDLLAFLFFSCYGCFHACEREHSATEK